MTTIDNNMLDTVTGGTVTTAVNATNINRPELHMLKKLNHTLTNLTSSQQSDSSNQTMLLMAALFASRRF